MNAALRIGVLGCFVSHGILALVASAVPYSEWNVWVQRLLPGGDMTAAMWFLRIVGGLDVAAGLSMLLPRVPRAAFVWTIGWGVATATSRIVFLGALAGPFWITIGYPLAEFLARAANWAVPLLLYRRLSARPLPVLGDVSEHRWLLVVVLFTTIGWTLGYFVEMGAPTYPTNVLRTGEPLWMFHASGAAAALAALSIWQPAATRAVAAWVPLAALVVSEAIAAWFLHRPRGPLMASLQIVEHAPLFVALAWWALAQRGATLTTSVK
jgi:hypothetical protein